MIEFKMRGDSDEDAMDKLVSVKGEVSSAISKSHGRRSRGSVLVAPGSIDHQQWQGQRAACAEQYGK